jgi:outer membrane protein assembly factor BamD
VNRYFAAAAAFSLLLSGCGTDDKPFVARPLKDLYCDARKLMSQEHFEDAAEAFNEVERQHPYSEWASKAQIMSAYCSFKAQNFEKAIAVLEVFIALHPGSQLAPYAYYLKGLCYYYQIYNLQRDGENAQLSSQAFQEIIDRFPETDYAEDARFKIDFAQEHLASQEMLRGFFYLQRESYFAALRHFSNMISQFPRSFLMPEALYRTAEAQAALNLPQAVCKTKMMLEHNFPQNPWTKMAAALYEKHFGRESSFFNTTAQPKVKRILKASSKKYKKIPKTDQKK